MAEIDSADLLQYTFVLQEQTTSTDTTSVPDSTVDLPDGTQLTIPGYSYDTPNTSTVEVFKQGYINRNYVTAVRIASNITRTMIKLTDSSEIEVTTNIVDVVDDLTTP